MKIKAPSGPEQASVVASAIQELRKKEFLSSDGWKPWEPNIRGATSGWLGSVVVQKSLYLRLPELKLVFIVLQAYFTISGSPGSIAYFDLPSLAGYYTSFSGWGSFASSAPMTACVFTDGGASEGAKRTTFKRYDGAAFTTGIRGLVVSGFYLEV